MLSSVVSVAGPAARFGLLGHGGQVVVGVAGPTDEAAPAHPLAADRVTRGVRVLSERVRRRAAVVAHAVARGRQPWWRQSASSAVRTAAVLATRSPQAVV